MSRHFNYVDDCMEILKTLIEWDEPITKTELVLLLGKEKNFAHELGLLNALAFAELISFTVSHDDPRLVWVKIEPLGRMIYDERK